MGAWGVAPFENDTAADWFATNVEQPLSLAAGAGLKSKKPDVVRAACCLLEQLGHTYTWDTYTLNDQLIEAINCLTRISEDGEYIRPGAGGCSSFSSRTRASARCADGAPEQ